MRSLHKREPLVLLVGDAALFVAALWLTLALRYLEPPSWRLFELHLTPFSLLFLAWLAVFFVAGLYNRHTSLFARKLPGRIVNAQAANVILAALFFFVVPTFAIAPKTNLVIYLLVSSALIMLWRLEAFPRLSAGKRERALLIGGGREFKELYEEINEHPKYDIYFEEAVNVDRLDGGALSERIYSKLRDETFTVVVVDAAHKKIENILPHLYKPIFSNTRFIDANVLYEEVFERLPLTTHSQGWVVENISLTSHIVYDIPKRLVDFTLALFGFAATLPLYPLVWCAVRLDDGGPLFFTHERVGRNNIPVRIVKFRSMRVDGKEEVTRLGSFLRKTRIDELPQLWLVLKGDLSLIGPRPELPHLVEHYEEEVPSYNLRHLIKPGLSGWAQIHQDDAPRFGKNTEATRIKLSYDLYYIKNRSLWLDIKIILQTVTILLSRSGV